MAGGKFEEQREFIFTGKRDAISIILQANYVKDYKMQIEIQTKHRGNDQRQEVKPLSKKDDIAIKQTEYFDNGYKSEEIIVEHASQNTKQQKSRS